MSCNSVQKQISAYLDGQLSEAEVESALKHAQACETCSSVLSDFQNIQELVIQHLRQKEPSPQIWQTLQLRINAENIVTSKRQNKFTWISGLFDRLFLQRPIWVRAAVFATIVLISLTVGINAWYFNKQRQEIQILSSKEIVPESSKASMWTNTKVHDELLLKERLGDFLRKSNLVLTEIENFEQPEDVEFIDFSPEKTISKNLASETRYIKRNLTGSQYEYLEDLIDDLEMVFLDIANLDESKVQDEVELLGGAIAQKDLLMKINVIKLNGGPKTIPHKKSRKIGA